MLTIVVPMAGKGSRFVNEGYTLPKPLIEIHGKPMISYVISNTMPKQEHRFVFLCLQEHIDRYHIDKTLHFYSNNCIIIPVNEVTEGAACTVLLAEQWINNDDPLMIVNSDQYVDIDINQYLDMVDNIACDGSIMTMKATQEHWSYIRIDQDGYLLEIQEKKIISDEATVGIYNYSRGRDFVSFAKKMIDCNDRVNGEFYVAPVYNYMVEAGKKIGYCNIGSVDNAMYGLGTPRDLEYFRNLPLSESVCRLIKERNNIL